MKETNIRAYEFYREFGLNTHENTSKKKNPTFSGKHLFTGGELAAQTLPPLYLDTAQETIGRTGETPEKDGAAKTSIFHQLGWKPRSPADKEGCDVVNATSHLRARKKTTTPTLSAFQQGEQELGGKVCQDQGGERRSSRTKGFKRPERGRSVCHGASRQRWGT